MTDLERYEIINKCETKEELVEAILKIADEQGNIQNRKKPRPAQNTASHVHNVINGFAPAKYLTRAFGIRQQALYIKYYLDLKKYEAEKV